MSAVVKEVKDEILSKVKSGENIKQVSEQYGISDRTIYNWLRRSDLAPSPRGPCDRKLKKDELAAHVKAHPDALLRERAAHFGVCASTVWTALHKMEIRKKNHPLR